MLLTLALPAAAALASGQVETVTGTPPNYVWEHRLRVEGHLALNYSPDGAFSPDGSTLAVVNKDKVALARLADGRIDKVFRPRFRELAGLDIQSANFVAPSRLFLLASGLVKVKGRGATGRAPELAFQWDVLQDSLIGKLEAVGVSGGFLPVRYFPRIRYLVLYKNNTFDVWDPVTGRGGHITVPAIAHAPHLFAFSPDGRWLILAQIEMNASPNPVVVLLKDHSLADVLPGHGGTVLSIMFSRDGGKLVTACEDGDVRIFSVPDWKLLLILTGHRGPAHWAEFSPHGNWVASAGEDKTVRIWSATTGKLVQTLSESRKPLLTVAFSPNGQYLAASSANAVHVWACTALN